MSESGVIFDGVLGLNKAEVNANNAVKVFIDSSTSLTINIDSVTGSAADAQKVAIFDPVTGQIADVDANGSQLIAAIDSVGLYIENKAEVLLVAVTATTTQSAISSVQTNLNAIGALFYVVTSTTATTTVRLNFQTTCEFLNRFITIASASIDGVTSAVTRIHFYPGAGDANAFSGILPRTFRVETSITSSTTNAFTPSITIGMKKAK